MKTSRNRRLGHGALAILAIFSAVAAGCTDVGDDNTASGGSDAAGDAEGADTSLGTDTSTGGDGQAGSDGTVGEDAEGDAGVDSTSPAPDSGEDAGITEEPEAAAPEAGAAETGAPEAGAPEAGVEAGAAEAGAPEAGAAEAGAPEAGTPEAGTPEAGVDAGQGVPDASEADAVAESGTEAGGGSSALVPCVNAGQTNCVPCDQNMDGLCSGTEAILVTRDIEKGLLSGDHLNLDTSCYECAVTNGDINSDIQGFAGEECEDIGTASAVQLCLNALNCFVGSPQSGTVGAGGTNSGAGAAALTADCSNESPAGVFNCFCGPAEPDVSDCKAGGTVAAMASGGVGVASPNGACIQEILAGTGTTSSTINATVIGDLNNANLGAGEAATIVQNFGSNITTPACAQCFQ
jgi:hypothetical protein